MTIQTKGICEGCDKLRKVATRGRPNGRTMYRLEIETNNAAFEGTERDQGLARILREEASRIETRGATTAPRFLHDINGNTVGTAGLGTECEASS